MALVFAEIHPCAEPTAAEARYLAAILELRGAGAAVTQAAVARRLGVSAPSVLEMIRRLRALGLVRADSVALTARGTSAALVLESRRAAAHALTHDVLGIDDPAAEREAEHLAGAVSPALGRRLVARRPRTHPAPPDAGA